MPTQLLASAAFFCAFMGENWMTKMAENWEITDTLLHIDRLTDKQNTSQFCFKLVYANLHKLKTQSYSITPYDCQQSAIQLNFIRAIWGWNLFRFHPNGLYKPIITYVSSLYKHPFTILTEIQFSCSFFVQSSTYTASTRSTSRALFLTKTKSSAAIWASINISIGPIVVPFRSRSGRILPYSSAA